MKQRMFVVAAMVILAMAASANSRFREKLPASRGRSWSLGLGREVNAPHDFLKARFALKHTEPGIDLE